MKKKKILITGGTGFIGSNIARYLVNRGHDITVMEKTSKKIQRYN